MKSIRLAMLLIGSFVAVAPSQTPTLDGVWRSQGYGYVFEIEGTALRAFEVTATTCVPGLTARRDATSVPGQEARPRDQGGLRRGGCRASNPGGSVGRLTPERRPALALALVLGLGFIARALVVR
jgi:hypothetical protein